MTVPVMTGRASWNRIASGPSVAGATAPARPPVEVSPTITDQEFHLLRTLIRSESGIHLAESKKPLLVRRLSRRLRELGLTSFFSYYRLVKHGDPEERTRMLDCICTNETKFFREPRQFGLLEREILPVWQAAAADGLRSRRVRVWSAACSTGEEPYSIAMLLLHRLGASGWDLGVLATDLSTRALEQARQAIWPLRAARSIPPPLLKRYMLKGARSQEGKVKAGREIRSLVRFERLNLNEETYPVAGPFDLLFCRNAVMYFDPAARSRVLRRLVALLAPGGYLFLGHAENLNGERLPVHPVIPSVYLYRAERLAAEGGGLGPWH